MTLVRFDVTDPASSMAAELLRLFKEDVNERYPDELVRDIDIDDFVSAGGVFMVLYIDNAVAGCSAFYPLDKNSVELKRMYLKPPYRGKGMSRHMLAQLEDVARKQGFEAMKLETGRRQPEAIGLYLSEAYHEIDPFGAYINDPNSICFEKPL